MKNPRSTVEELRRFLAYDSNTGSITWLVARGRLAKIGQVAGSIDSKGHRQIKVHGETFMAHQIAWALHFGVWPFHQIDHQDGDRDNNKINNLRPATNSQNAQNRKMRKDNLTGKKGVRKNGSRWSARIQVNGKRVCIGTFRTVGEAHDAYQREAFRLFGEYANFGESHD